MAPHRQVQIDESNQTGPNRRGKYMLDLFLTDQVRPDFFTKNWFSPKKERKKEVFNKINVSTKKLLSPKTLFELKNSFRQKKIWTLLGLSQDFPRAFSALSLNFLQASSH